MLYLGLEMSRGEGAHGGAHLEASHTVLPNRDTKVRSFSHGGTMPSREEVFCMVINLMPMENEGWSECCCKSLLWLAEARPSSLA